MRHQEPHRTIATGIVNRFVRWTSEHLASDQAAERKVSNGVQKGPPIGVEEAPLLVDGAAQSGDALFALLAA